MRDVLPPDPRARPSRVWLRRALTALLLSSAGAGPIAAAEYRLFDRLSLVAGSYFDSTATRLRVDGSVGIGDGVDLETELGLDGSETLLRLRVEFRPWNRHQFSIGYYEFDRGATRVIDRDVEFGDVVFPINSEITSSFGVQLLEASYTYWFVTRNRVGFGGSLGLVQVSVDAGLRAVVLGLEGELEESASTDLPVPVLGLELRYGILEKLIFLSYAQVLPSVTVGDVGGSVHNLAVALEYRALRHVGFGVAFNSFGFDVDVDKRSLVGALDFQDEGLQLFVRAGF